MQSSGLCEHHLTVSHPNSLPKAVWTFCVLSENSGRARIEAQTLSLPRSHRYLSAAQGCLHPEEGCEDLKVWARVFVNCQNLHFDHKCCDMFLVDALPKNDQFSLVSS